MQISTNYYPIYKNTPAFKGIEFQNENSDFHSEYKKLPLDLRDEFEGLVGEHAIATIVGGDRAAVYYQEARGEEKTPLSIGDSMLKVVESAKNRLFEMKNPQPKEGVRQRFPGRGSVVDIDA